MNEPKKVVVIGNPDQSRLVSDAVTRDNHLASLFIEAMSMGGMDRLDDGFDTVHKIRRQEAHKCRLPSCDILTTHNGGYCSGDHCREHNQMLREKK